MVVSDSVWVTLITAFAKDPSMLMLACVLFGLGFLGYRFVNKFGEHGDAVAKSLESMNQSLLSLKEDSKEIKVILTDREHNK